MYVRATLGLISLFLTTEALAGTHRDMIGLFGSGLEIQQALVRGGYFGYGFFLVLCFFVNLSNCHYHQERKSLK